MNFPDLKKLGRTHMPFFNECNGQIIYMCCVLCNEIWKIFYYKNNTWQRLTNSQSNITECNPNICYYDNQYIVSYIEFNNYSGYKKMKILSGNSLQNLKLSKQFNALNGFMRNNKIYISKDCDSYQLIIDETQKYKYTIPQCKKILRMTYNPTKDNQLIITYITDNNTITCSIQNDEIKEIVSNNKFPTYKLFKYNNEYWNVLKFNNSEHEQLRFIIKDNCQQIMLPHKLIKEVL